MPPKKSVILATLAAEIAVGKITENSSGESGETEHRNTDNKALLVGIMNPPRYTLDGSRQGSHWLIDSPQVLF